MKIYRYFLSTIVIIVLLPSCKDALVENPKSVAKGNFYNNDKEVEAAIGAIYEPLRAGNGFRNYYMGLLVCNAEDIKCRGSWVPTSSYHGYNTTNIIRVGNAWDQFYVSIRNANLVIQNTPDAADINENKKKEYIGEAKFLRAFDYFHLVRNWGGVPIRTAENMTEGDVPRAKEKEVWELIINDLEFAVNNLPDDVSVSGHPTKWAAQTVLADVYFYQNMYGKASQEAKEVIESGKYSLVQVSQSNDFQNLYGPTVTNSPEEIFYFKYNSQDGNGWLSWAHGVGTPYFSQNGIYLYHTNEDATIYKNWDSNDLRKKYNWYEWETSIGKVLLQKKWTDAKSTNARNDQPIYRYADLLLIYAEASARAVDHPTADGMEKLNMVHRRAYGYKYLQPSPVDFNITNYNEQSFIDLVIKERLYEQRGEGKRWFDLKRLGKKKLKEYIKKYEGIDVADKHIMWPLPESEITHNDSIEPEDQNLGY